MDIWNVLGMRRTADAREIRRAYARALKSTSPEDNPEGFRRLREAYELALAGAAGASARAIGVHIAHDKQPWHAGQENATEAREEPPGATETPARGPAADTVQSRSAELAREVLCALETRSEAKALETFAAIVASEELSNLRLRDAFEETIASALAGLQVLPAYLIDQAASHFGWQDGVGYLLERMPREMGRLLGRLHARKVMANLTRVGKDDSRYRPVRILTGRYSPWVYWFFALHKPLVKRMRSALVEFRHRAPEVFDYEIDRRIVDWWSGRVERARLYWHHFLLVATVLPIILAQGKGVPPDETAFVWRAGLYIAGGALMLALCYGWEALEPRWTAARQILMRAPWFRGGWMPMFGVLVVAAWLSERWSYAAVITLLWLMVAAALWGVLLFQTGGWMLPLGLIIAAAWLSKNWSYAGDLSLISLMLPAMFLGALLLPRVDPSIYVGIAGPMALLWLALMWLMPAHKGVSLLASVLLVMLALKGEDGVLSLGWKSGNPERLDRVFRRGWIVALVALAVVSSVSKGWPSALIEVLVAVWMLVIVWALAATIRKRGDLLVALALPAAIGLLTVGTVTTSLLKDAFSWWTIDARFIFLFGAALGSALYGVSGHRRR